MRSITGLAYSAVKKAGRTRDHRGYRGAAAAGGGAAAAAAGRDRPAAAGRAAAADQHLGGAAADPDGDHAAAAGAGVHPRRAAAPAPPPAPSKARGATPDGQGRWAARIQENYPARAIRDETEGTRRRARHDRRRTAASPPAASPRPSGSPVLDEAACDGMTRYARYNPALDDAGNPTTGSADHPDRLPARQIVSLSRHFRREDYPHAY